MIGLKGFLSDLDDSLLYKLRIARVFHHYYYSLENWSRTALGNLSLLGKSIAISFWDPLRRTRDLEEEEEGFLWTTWQINDASAVTFISIGSAVNISSTWASPWNTLAGLTYRTLCLFQSVLVGIHYRQLGQGLEEPVQKAPAMFTVLHKPRHGTTWVALATQSPSVSVKMRQYYGNTAPVWLRFFYPAHNKSVLLSCTWTIWLSGSLLMALYMDVDGA